MIQEINKVLTSNGCCYFAATQFAKDTAGYKTNNLNYFGIRELINCFTVKDYTIKVLTNPDTFHMRIRGLIPAIIRLLPIPLLSILIPIFPSFIFILSKKDSNYHLSTSL